MHDEILALPWGDERDGPVTPDVLLLALDSAADAIAILSAAPNGRQELSRFDYVNRAFEQLYQCSRADVIHKDLKSFFASRSNPEQFARTMATLAEGKPFSHTRQLPRPDGTHPWIDVNFQPFGNGRWIYIIRDITEIHSANARVTQLLSAVDRAAEPIAIHTFDGTTWRYDFVNEAFLNLTGFERAELQGSLSSSITSSKTDIARVERNRELLLEGETIHGEAELHHKDGTTVVVEFTSKPLREETTGLVMSTVTVFHDVTESRRRNARLVDQATRDGLTGLYNRHYMETAIEEGIRRLRKGAADQLFLFIDLDGFKRINDRYGHERGDEALRTVARALQSCIWHSDVLARWGGDEFCALVRHCSLERGVEIGARMIAAVAQAEPELGASIGASMLSTTLGETLRIADRACYAAKRAGGNRVVTSAML